MPLTAMLDRLRHGRAEALRRSAQRSFDKGENTTALRTLLALKDEASDADLFRLGSCYEHGIGALPNPTRAVHWYEAAAARGYLPAMEKLGDIYLTGRPTAAQLRGAVKKDPAKALYWNQRAAEGGLPEAQARLASQYATGLGTAPDRAQAERWFHASAEQGCASGQFGLGALYFGAFRDEAADRQAVQWFEKAADQGNTAAQMCLAIALLDGRGTAPDAQRAAKLMTQAADGGQIEAMFRIGQLYRTDGSAGKNNSKAESWLRRAGIRGHRDAMLALAQLLTEDLQSPDYIGAAAVLREAADRGDARAFVGLGRLYATGNGVAKDPIEAKRWFLKARQAGVAEAEQALIDLEAAVALDEETAASAAEGDDVRQEIAEAKQQLQTTLEGIMTDTRRALNGLEAPAVPEQNAGYTAAAAPQEGGHPEHP